MPRNIGKARKLGAAIAVPERLLWQHLRGNPDGVKIRRPQPINDDYVLDFYCASAKVCIEVDGISHDMGERPARDAVRDAVLAEHGIETLRVRAAEVLKSQAEVADGVVRYCKAKKPLRQP